MSSSSNQEHTESNNLEVTATTQLTTENQEIFSMQQGIFVNNNNFY